MKSIFDVMGQPFNEDRDLKELGVLMIKLSSLCFKK